MKITVNASKKYDVVIGKNLLSSCGELVRSVVDSGKAVVITDSNVDKLYSSCVIESLKANGFEVSKFVFQAGEKSKNLTNYAEILSFLAKSSIMRGDVIVALGGGVTGDMAGFAAATYMRGIKYVQIPTTLLAAIDSSVGGKTAVDLPEGKNLVGAFCQPEIVIVDVDAFSTLPKEIFDDGMGELAKYAMLCGGEIETLIMDGVNNNIERLVYLCVDYKREIVERDEFEKGDRKLLNLGHTPAHGIEKVSNFSVSHGKAVGMGLRIIAKASYLGGMLTKSEYDRVIDVLKKTNQEEESSFDKNDVFIAALNDKKRTKDGITIVTLHGMGDARLTDMTEAEAEEFLCK